MVKGLDSFLSRKATKKIKSTKIVLPPCYQFFKRKIEIVEIIRKMLIQKRILS